jgi:hypothetical protein
VKRLVLMCAVAGLFCCSMAGCGIFMGGGSGMVHDPVALKASENVLLVDTFFIDTLVYYDNDTDMCYSSSYSEAPGITESVKQGLQNYFPVYYSTKLKDEFKSTVQGNLRNGCFNIFKMPAFYRSLNDSEEGKKAFAELALKASNSSGEKFDLYAVVTVQYQATDACARDGATGSSQHSNQCKEPKQGMAVPTGSVLVTLAVVDISGTVNKLVYSDAEGLGFGRNKAPKASFKLNLNVNGDKSTASSNDEQKKPENPFAKWKRAEKFEKLTAIQKKYVAEKTVEVTKILMSRFEDRMKEGEIPNRTAPKVIDIDSRLKW